MLVAMPPSTREGKKIVVYQSHAKLIFDGDSWAASDLGDYSNFETGEGCSGRFPQPEGPFLWALAFRDYVLAGKKHAAFKGRYVGGCMKWRWDVSMGELPEAWWPDAARWACRYCQSTHPRETEKCTSCGAHR